MVSEVFDIQSRIETKVIISCWAKAGFVVHKPEDIVDLPDTEPYEQIDIRLVSIFIVVTILNIKCLINIIRLLASTYIYPFQ